VKILYVMPVTVSGGEHGSSEMKRRQAILQQWAFADCRVTVSDLDIGPQSVESSAEEYLAVPGLLQRVIEAEKEGFDAVIDGCFTDPGIHACREVVSIPVLGPGECSMLAAASVCHRFSIITALEGLVRPLERLVKTVGLETRLASVRQADIPVLELGIDPDESYRRVLNMGRDCLDTDGADTLILGCMSMAFLGDSERLQSDLGVPVVNPALVTLKFAEMLVQANLASSKIAYPPPPKPLPLPMVPNR
jgi:allantoin racemase